MGNFGQYLADNIEHNKRNCPSCGKELVYSSKRHLKRAITNNTKCVSCSKSGKNNPMYGVDGNKHPMHGKDRPDLVERNKSEKQRMVVKKAQTGKNNSMYGKENKWGNHTEKTKELISINTKKAMTPEVIDKIKKARSKQVFTDEQIEYCRRKTIEGKLGISFETYINTLPKFKKYKNKVWRLTRKQDLQSLDNYDKRGRSDNNIDAYHLDHKISIYGGFHNNIPEEEIADISNLRMIHWKENVTKNIKSIYE